MIYPRSSTDTINLADDSSDLLLSGFLDIMVNRISDNTICM